MFSREVPGITKLQLMKGAALLLMTILVSCSQTNITDSVNVFVGTGGHGHTTPAATVPFGMVQLGPDTREKGWDGCSGYHYSDNFIYGFSHTHLSGTGVADYSDILILPMSGSRQEVKTDSTGRYGSSFLHENEFAEPGYYKVELHDYSVTAELTATKHCGMHRYIFQNATQSRLLLDLTYRDVVLDSKLKIKSSKELSGYRFSKGWAKDQRLFFDIKFNREITKIKFIGKDSLAKGQASITGKDIRVLLYFDMKDGDELLVKTGLSGVDEAGAAKNLDAEIPHWNFLQVRDAAEKTWNKELSKITVESENPEEKSIFYTALYHSFTTPNIYSDTDGRYRGRDMKIHKADFDYYTVFSLWDTYRAEHPLLTIIDKKRTADFIKTFIRQYEEGGLLPVWELSANETNCMIGKHAIPVIADAMVNGVEGFDKEKAFEAMKASMEEDTLELNLYRSMGYIPSDQISFSVSKTLEYAYDDWCIARVAYLLNHRKDYDKYIKRAQFYKNVFDASTLKMRPRYNGGWLKPFDPKKADFNYTEANAWQYSFYVPQDIQTLIDMNGGDSAFIDNLDELFNTDSEITGLKIADMTGLIGQYAHGNEPSHHIAYLYSYAGAAWKTQAATAKIRRMMYHNSPDGICGNEDCGQMSAWYVFSSLGFYPVQPASGIYVFGSPAFDKATIKLENGNKFIIKRKGRGDYIEKVTLNGKKYSRSYITYDVINKGGTLVFEMSKKANKDFGRAQSDRPVSRIKSSLLPTPVIINNKNTFYDSLTVEFSKPAAGEIFYSIDKGDIKKYSGPFSMKKDFKIRWQLVDGQDSSMWDKAVFVKAEAGRSIVLKTAYSQLYKANGDKTLIDFMRGSKNFADGKWQGYEGNDLHAVIDLGKIKRVNKISMAFLQNIKSWIWMPEYVEYRVSTDGKEFHEAGKVKNTIPERKEGVIVKDFSIKVNSKNIRYIEVFGKSKGTCPAWHKGYPLHGKAWIFADELRVE